MIDFKLPFQCRIFQYQIMAPQQENIPFHCTGEHPFQHLSLTQLGLFQLCQLLFRSRVFDRAGIWPPKARQEGGSGNV